MKKIFFLLVFMISALSTCCATEQDRNILTSMAGRSVWVNKNSPIVIELTAYKDNHFSYLYNLEKLNIKFVDLDNHVIVLEKDNGEILNWIPKRVASEVSFQSTLPKDIDHELILSIGNVFYWKDPKEMFPDWSEEVWDGINNQQVKIGWDEAKCMLSWGEPKRINTTTNSWGTHEQWVYNLYCYLYFDNGILTNIQN